MFCGRFVEFASLIDRKRGALKTGRSANSGQLGCRIRQPVKRKIHAGAALAWFETIARDRSMKSGFANMRPSFVGAGCRPTLLVRYASPISPRSKSHTRMAHRALVRFLCNRPMG